MLNICLNLSNQFDAMSSKQAKTKEVLILLSLLTTSAVADICHLRDTSLQSKDFLIKITRAVQEHSNCNTVIFENVTGYFDGEVLASILTDAKELKIVSSKLDRVHRLCFSPHLRQVSIGFKDVFIKPDEILFEDCGHITVLELHGGEITNTTFIKLPKLRVLNMVDVSLNRLDKELFKSLPDLVQLRVAQSKIFDISPGALCMPPNLVKLSLKDNLVFPNLTLTLMNNCNNVKSLYLSGNSEWVLEEDALNTMGNLEDLSISGIKIPRLSKELFRACSNLRLLQLTENGIKSINSDTFSKMKQLEVLNIKYSDIEEIPPGTFQDLNSLEVLDLLGNRIKSLENIKDMPSLRKLDISWNQISGIDAKVLMDNFPNLNHLIVFGNDLTCKEKRNLASELNAQKRVDFQGIFDDEICSN